MEDDIEKKNRLRGECKDFCCLFTFQLQILSQLSLPLIITGPRELVSVAF